MRVDGKVNDADQLLLVLECLGRSLDRINIKFSSLDQEIFDGLPKQCPILSELFIEEEHQIDPAFILNFESLKIVNFNQKLEEEFVRDCFQKYEYFESFCLHDDHWFLRSPEDPSQLIEIDSREKMIQKEIEALKELNLDFF